MAYSSTITTYKDRDSIIVEVSETDVSSSDEATINVGYQMLILDRILCELDSGTGTTVDPILEGEDAGSNRRVQLENLTPDAVIDESVSGGLRVFSAGGDFYLRTEPDAGADNVVRTILYFRRVA